MSFSKKQNTKKKVGESKKVSTKKSQGLMAFVGTKKSVKRETIPELIVDKPKKAQKINKLDRWIYGTQLVEQNKIDPVEVYNTPDPTPEPEQIIQPKKMKREKPVLTPTKKAVAIKGETITLEKPTFPKKYNYKQHLEGNYISDCSLINRYIFKKIYPFKLEHSNHAFWDFFKSFSQPFCDLFAISFGIDSTR